MNLSGKHINHCWAGLLIEELTRQGCGFFAVSPGSRSTPLALAVADTPRATHAVHYDERGSAFCALGYAKATGMPAAVICTSGSAAANLWPVIVEAETSRVPLIVVTADRPPELLHAGANQAIDQEGLFGKYARWAATLPCPTIEIPPRYVLTTAAQAVHRATGSPRGPVHLNCMYREPLAPVPPPQSLDSYLHEVQHWLHGGKPWTSRADTRQTLSDASERDLIALVASAQRGVLAVGQLRNAAEAQSVFDLAQTLQWPVLADITSGLRGRAAAPCIHYYDQLLLSEEGAGLLGADIVLHIGGRLTSKRLNEHLDRLCAAGKCVYVQLLDDPARQDPSHRVCHRFEADLAPAAHWLAAAMRGHRTHFAHEPLAAASARVSGLIDQWDGEQTLPTEIGVARRLSRLLPAECTLFPGNSMPIRDMDMYSAPDTAPFRVIANRGASGIDGNIATAAGIARGARAPVVALVGDLATLHDMNSLALLRGLETPFLLIVINNDGGGIFSFLPIAEEKATFEPFFGTPHGMDFQHAAGQFQIEYACPETLEAFEAVVIQALQQNRPCLIEVRTRREDSFRQHLDLQERLRRALDADA